MEGGGGSDITVDAELSDTSTNPVQNKVVKAALDNRAVLDDVNTFTSPNNFDDIYMEDGINSLNGIMVHLILLLLLLLPKDIQVKQPQQRKQHKMAMVM